MANILLGYWYKLYKDQTKYEQTVEKEVAKLGVRYRTQHPFIKQKPAAFADFYFPDHSLVVEIDDPSHEEDAKRAKDIERTKALNTLGLKVIRFTNAQVLTELPWIISQIETELRSEPSESAADQEEYPSTLAQPLKGTSRRKRPPSPKRSKRT